MLKTSEDIKKISLINNNIFMVSTESGKIKCKLVQETEWLFIFEIIDETKAAYKRKCCITKVDYYLNNAIIKPII